MNREIKFRGKRKYGDEWLIGDLNHIDGKVFIFPRTEDAPLNSPDWFEVEPESVGQYTGLKDKNGVEIYEGDVLKIFKCKIVEEVLYEGSAFGFFKHTTINRHSGTFEILDDYTGSSGYEIVGNIYQNPELLK